MNMIYKNNFKTIIVFKVFILHLKIVHLAILSKPHFTKFLLEVKDFVAENPSKPLPCIAPFYCTNFFFKIEWETT